MYLKVSAGITENNLTNSDRIQSIDTTAIKYPTQGGFLLKQ